MKLQSADFAPVMKILVFVVEQKSLWRKRLIVGTRCEVCPPFYLKSLMLFKILPIIQKLQSIENLRNLNLQIGGFPRKLRTCPIQALKRLIWIWSPLLNILFTFPYHSAEAK